ncbi:AAA family ATPase [Catellatospora citrea]|uniref:AAA family ATPase n=1 Tax=Catellatospora citrea TaxID=53366 RepID=UPI0033CE1DE4
MSTGSDSKLPVRLQNAIDFNAGETLYTLCGPGVQDQFVGPDHQVRTLEQSLWEILHAEGFRRISFTSTVNSLCFLDAESLRLAVPGTPPAPAGQQRMRFFTNGGPVGNEFERPPAPPAIGAAPTMSDAQLAGILGAYMRDTEVRSAVVIMMVEDFFGHVGRASPEAMRLYAENISDWSRGDRTGRNASVLVFSADSVRSAATAIGESRLLVALHAHLHRQEQRTGARAAGIIGAADDHELSRLVHAVRVRRSLECAWEELPEITVAMSVQPGMTLRNWRSNLDRLADLGVALTGEELMRRGMLEELPAGEGVWTDLDRYEGWDELRRHLERVQGTATVESAHGRPLTPADHLVFTGNPGTGKTTAARLVGALYRNIGLLRRGHVHQPDPSELIGRYQGWGVAQVDDAFAKALDGVLFIDEAYKLVQGGVDAGREVINSLVERMEDARGTTVVIFGGYRSEMRQFIRANPGMDGRTTRIGFADFEPGQLVNILRGQLRKHEHTWDGDVDARLVEIVRSVHAAKGERFANGRSMRKISEQINGSWASRIARGATIGPLLLEDLPDDGTAVALGAMRDEEGE